MFAAFAPPSVRFVGANSNLIQPGRPGLLAQQIETAIRSHAGPLWGLELPEGAPGQADETLRYYGLRRGPGCAPDRSNLDGTNPPVPTAPRPGRRAFSGVASVDGRGGSPAAKPSSNDVRRKPPKRASAY